MRNNSVRESMCSNGFRVILEINTGRAESSRALLRAIVQDDIEWYEAMWDVLVDCSNYTESLADVVAGTRTCARCVRICDHFISTRVLYMSCVSVCA